MIPAAPPFGSRERSVLIDEAARLLGVSRRTVYYCIREGRLRTIRTQYQSQRVLRSSLDALLEQRAAIRAARKNAGARTGLETEALALQVEAFPRDS